MSWPFPRVRSEGLYTLKEAVSPLFYARVVSEPRSEYLVPGQHPGALGCVVALVTLCAT